MGPNGIHVLDVAVPTSPVLISTIDAGNVWATVAVDSILYAVGFSSALQVFDVSDPGIPVELYVAPFTDDASDISYHDGLLYISTTTGIKVLDATNPPYPTIGGTSAPDVAFEIENANEIAAMLVRHEGIFIYDVSFTTVPLLVTSLESQEFNNGDLDLAGQTLFWTNETEGLQFALLTGCGLSAPGDSDGDGDVDLVDFAQFSLCFTGPDGSCSGNCCIMDFDDDGDIDLADFSNFQLAFTGPM
jgi:hypothetical protein